VIPTWALESVEVELSRPGLAKARRKLQGKDLGNLFLVFLSVSSLVYSTNPEGGGAVEVGGDWIHAYALHPSHQQRIKLNRPTGILLSYSLRVNVE